MKTLIGYRFVINLNNQDYDEWERIFHFESPIYTNKNLAEEHLNSFAKNYIPEFLKRKYFDSDIIEDIMEDLENSRIEEVFVENELSSDFIHYNIGD